MHYNTQWDSMYNVLYSAMSITHTRALRHGSHSVLRAKLHHACILFRKRSPDGATTNWGVRHLIGACYSFIDPEGMKGWVGVLAPLWCSIVIEWLGVIVIHTVLVQYNVLPLESWCKGSSVPSLRSPVVDDEKMRSVGDFPCVGLTLSAPLLVGWQDWHPDSLSDTLVS